MSNPPHYPLKAACHLLIVPAGRGSGQGPTLCPRCLWTYSDSAHFGLICRPVPSALHIPWLSKTLLQDELRLARFACRHCCTALSSPRFLRQKRWASREQAACSCLLPICWACALAVAPITTAKPKATVNVRMNVLRVERHPTWRDDDGSCAFRAVEV